MVVRMKRKRGLSWSSFTVQCLCQVLTQHEPPHQLSTDARAMTLELSTLQNQEVDKFLFFYKLTSAWHFVITTESESRQMVP